MTFSVDARDVELYSGASFGFKGLFDEEGKESWESKIMSDEDYKEAMEWSKDFMNKVYKSKTLDELNKNMPSNVPYYLEISDNTVVLNWSCPNRVHGEYHFGFSIVYANIS